MGAFGQPIKTTDTIVLSKSDALKVLTGALQGKVYKEQRDSLHQDIITLNKLIEIKSLEISNLNDQTQNYKSIVVKYDQQIIAMTQQRELLESQANNLSKLYRKERRKAVFWKVSTVVGIAAGIFLGSKL